MARPTRKLKGSRLAPVLGFALLASACGGGSSEPTIASTIDCLGQDLPSQYVRQLDGSFTNTELIAVGVGDAPQTDALIGGHFSSWTETVDEIPFDLPGNILCQVLVFDEEEAADAFVDSLEATSASLSHASIGWPSAGELAVREISGDPSAESPETSVRAFTATGTDGGSEQQLLLLFESAGRYVVSVHAGGPSQGPDAEAMGEALASLRGRAIAASED